MIIFCFLFLNSVDGDRESTSRFWLKPYSIFGEHEKVQQESVTTLDETSTVSSTPDNRTVVLLSNVTMESVQRPKRFGAWESDLRIPNSAERVVKAFTDPFDLFSFLELMPEPLRYIFFAGLILITFLWNAALLTFVTWVSFKFLQLVFYALSKLAVLSMGYISRSCYKECARRCCYSILRKPPAESHIV